MTRVESRNATFGSCAPLGAKAVYLRQGEFVLEANIYVDMLPHLYMIERA